MIYQELSLAPHLSRDGEHRARHGAGAARACVRRREARDARRERRWRALGHPEIDPDAVVGTLSPAEQQLVEIARAFAVGCRVLVLDEPTSSLGRDGRPAAVRAGARACATQGHAIVYISHFLEEVKESPTASPCCATAGNAGEGARPAAARGRDRRADGRPARGRAVPARAARARRGRAGGRRAASRAAPRFALQRGEVLGIAGLVGAGRTRAAARAVRARARARRPRARWASYRGRRLAGAALAQGMGLVSEDRKGEGLALGARRRRQPHAVAPARPGPGSVGHARRGRTPRPRRWIDRLRSAAAGRSSRSPSCRAATSRRSRWRGCCTTTSTCCCSTSRRAASTSASKAQIYGLIDALVAGEQGRPPRAVLMVSSYFPELLGVCDRIAVMCRGRLGPARPVAELDEHRLVLEAAGGAA